MAAAAAAAVGLRPRPRGLGADGGDVKISPSILTGGSPTMAGRAVKPWASLPPQLASTMAGIACFGLTGSGRGTGAVTISSCSWIAAAVLLVLFGFDRFLRCWVSDCAPWEDATCRGLPNSV